MQGKIYPRDDYLRVIDSIDAQSFRQGDITLELQDMQCNLLHSWIVTQELHTKILDIRALKHNTVAPGHRHDFQRLSSDQISLEMINRVYQGFGIRIYKDGYDVNQIANLKSPHKEAYENHKAKVKQIQKVRDKFRERIDINDFKLLYLEDSQTAKTYKHLLRLITDKEHDADEIKALLKNEFFLYFKIDSMNWNVLDDSK